MLKVYIKDLNNHLILSGLIPSINGSSSVVSQSCVMSTVNDIIPSMKQQWPPLQPNALVW